jgi:transcriptional regulator with XRE-family HTH domain
MTRQKTIQELMKAANITQKQLADSFGVSQARVSQMLNPKGDPKLSTLRKLSRELGISLETLAATYHDRDEESGGEDTNN